MMHQKPLSFQVPPTQRNMIIEAVKWIMNIVKTLLKYTSKIYKDLEKNVGVIFLLRPGHFDIIFFKC